MHVFTILGLLAAVVLGVVAPFCICGAFDAACKKKFGVELLSLPAFVGVGVAAIMVWQGVILYHTAIAKHADISDAAALIGLGAGGILLTLYLCIRRTDVFHGIGATCLLIGFGIIVAPVMFIGVFCGAVAGDRYVVLQKRFLD